VACDAGQALRAQADGGWDCGEDPTAMLPGTSTTHVYPPGTPLRAIWTRAQKGPVLTNAGGGAWESFQVLEPAVMKSGGSFRMYYAGHNGSVYGGFGLATSSDGLSWARYSGNPVLARADAGFDSVEMLCPSVVYDGTTTYLFYTGGDGTVERIGLATSTDGTTFTRQGVVLPPAGGTAWDSKQTRCPSVLKEGSSWKMYYMGYTGTAWDGVGLATSSDGFSWTRYSGNPVLVSSQNWDRLQTAMPDVIKVGKTWYMIYTAFGNGSTSWQLGMATSLDGVSWTKVVINPVFPALAGTFYFNQMAGTSLVLDGDRAWLYYSGHDGTRWSIGAAVQPLP
jgi:predicted GH43/DUF377 family glycosyl hydrolase